MYINFLSLRLLSVSLSLSQDIKKYAKTIPVFLLLLDNSIVT